MPSKQYPYLRARKENAISNLFMTGTIIIDHYLHREKENCTLVFCLVFARPYFSINLPADRGKETRMQETPNACQAVF